MSKIKITVEIDDVVFAGLEMPVDPDPPVIDPTDPPDVVEYLEGRAIAKPTKDHVILWTISGWNNAHLKDPPRERGAFLVHPDMSERTFVPNGAVVHVRPESIKVDGGGRAFVVVGAAEAQNSAGYNVALTGGLYIKDTEIELR